MAALLHGIPQGGKLAPIPATRILFGGYLSNESPLTMHELSVAMNIIEIADEYAAKAGTGVVHEIEIEVGELSGVVMEALEFAMQVAVRNTLLEKTRLHYIRIPGRSKCRVCRHEFDTSNLYSPCPACNSFEQELVSGKELRVRSLIVD